MNTSPDTEPQATREIPTQTFNIKLWSVESLEVITPNLTTRKTLSQQKSNDFS